MCNSSRKIKQYIYFILASTTSIEGKDNAVAAAEFIINNQNMLNERFGMNTVSKQLYQHALTTNVPEGKQNIYLMMNMAYSVMLIAFSLSMYWFQDAITPTKELNRDNIEEKKFAGKLTSFFLLLAGLKQIFLYFLLYDQDKIKYIFFEIFIDPVTQTVSKNPNRDLSYDLITSILLSLLIGVVMLGIRYPTESLNQVFSKSQWDFKEIVVYNVGGKTHHVVSSYNNIVIKNIGLLLAIFFFLSISIAAMKNNISCQVTSASEERAKNLVYIQNTSQSVEDIVQSLYQ